MFVQFLFWDEQFGMILHHKVSYIVEYGSYFIHQVQIFDNEIVESVKHVPYDYSSNGHHTFYTRFVEWRIYDFVQPL